MNMQVNQSQMKKMQETLFTTIKKQVIQFAQLMTVIGPMHSGTISTRPMQS